MNRMRIPARAVEFARTFGAAVRASNAAQAGTRPARGDLAILGIDPSTYPARAA